MSLRHVLLIVGLSFLVSGCARGLDSQDMRLARDVNNGPVIEVPLPVPPPLNGAWGEPAVYPAAARGRPTVADTDGPYLLDTGDRLRVFVYGQPNLSRIYPVDQSGRITIPLIGRIKARGRTTRTLEAVIRRRLGAKFVKDPQVNVDMAQNRPFFILGEVRNPGQYPYVSGITVQAAVAIAGGYSERANERKTQITRRVQGGIERIEVRDNFAVKPGDTVKIPERFF